MLRSSRILNPALLGALSGAGHGQVVVIADAGLPMPPGVRVVDLSVVPGVPGFVDVVTAVVDHGAFEAKVVAAESTGTAPFDALATVLDGLPTTFVDHEEFKARLPGAHVIVRTGECTPYANVALVAGTTF